MIRKIGHTYQLQTTTHIPGSLEQVWEFFSTPHNLDRLTPPDMPFTIESSTGHRMFPGQIIIYKVGVLPKYTTRWVTEITHVQHRKMFVDEQRFGPYILWHHLHQFREVADGVEMTDTVHYRLPFGALGMLVAANYIRKRLEHIFHYRAQIIQKIFHS
ncbi:MAG: SRPBCC family protein [Weeksellaceae bacterium]|nr:SRPBCC family protein [Weeksellaceae bacterium]